MTPLQYPCPVCGTTMKRTIDRVEGTLCEEYEDCPNDCYHYAFAYGGWEYKIGDHEWYGHYTDSVEKMNTDRGERDVYIQLLRAQKAESQCP